MKKLFFIIFLFLPSFCFSATSTDSILPSLPVADSLLPIDLAPPREYKGLQEDVSLRSLYSVAFRDGERIIRKIYAKPLYVVSHEKTIFEWLVPSVYATTTPSFSGSGDGAVSQTGASWNACITGAGSGSGYGGSDANTLSQGDGASPYTIYKGVIPFSTSVIPSDAVIESASVFLNIAGIVANTDNDGDDYYVIVETFTASATTLQNDDYADIGYDEGNEVAGRGNLGNAIVEGSTQVDFSSFVANSYNEYELNATGLLWIKRDGESSTCGSGLTGTTCLGILEGHASLNHAIAPGTDNFAYWYTSENTGTSKDPYIEITYIIPEPEPESTDLTDEDAFVYVLLFFIGIIMFLMTIFFLNR